MDKMDKEECNFQCNFQCVFADAVLVEKQCHEVCNDDCPVWKLRFHDCHFCTNEECPYWECE